MKFDHWRNVDPEDLEDRNSFPKLVENAEKSVRDHIQSDYRSAFRSDVEFSEDGDELSMTMDESSELLNTAFEHTTDAGHDTGLMYGFNAGIAINSFYNDIVQSEEYSSNTDELFNQIEVESIAETSIAYLDRVLSDTDADPSSGTEGFRKGLMAAQHSDSADYGLDG